MIDIETSEILRRRTLVAGAGGFIGGHLVARLLDLGAPVMGIDLKPIEEWHQVHASATNLQLDLRELEACRRAVESSEVVFNLGADMGGMGYIENNRALCMLSVLINTHLMMAAREVGVKRYFYASSACVYAADRQTSPSVTALAEGDAYPAMPEDGYGWEKLFSERMCRHFLEDFGVQTRVARYHNVYGPLGTFDGGREKAPAAICRKVAQAVISGSDDIEIWGDGEQTRSFMYIDDCVYGSLMLAASDYSEPLNIGSDELVTINQLVDLVEDIAGVHLRRRYLPDAPLGVRGRNSDNRRIRAEFGWEPSTRLNAGLKSTFSWIFDELVRAGQSSGVR